LLSYRSPFVSATGAGIPLGDFGVSPPVPGLGAAYKTTPGKKLFLRIPCLLDSGVDYLLAQLIVFLFQPVDNQIGDADARRHQTQQAETQWEVLNRSVVVLYLADELFAGAYLL